MIKFERADGRWFYVSVEKDMFDDVVVVRRGGSGRSVCRRYACGTISGIVSYVSKVTRKRLQRGYIIVQ